MQFNGGIIQTDRHSDGDLSWDIAHVWSFGAVIITAFKKIINYSSVTNQRI